MSSIPATAASPIQPSTIVEPPPKASPIDVPDKVFGSGSSIGDKWQNFIRSQPHSVRIAIGTGVGALAGGALGMLVGGPIGAAIGAVTGGSLLFLATNAASVFT